MKKKPEDKPIGEARYHPCPNCGRITKQIVKLYNPKDPEGGKVWYCISCKKNVEWVLKLKYRK